MTTIVFDGRYLAGDGLAVYESGKVASTTTKKIFTPPNAKTKWRCLGKNVVAFGVAGVSGDWYEIIDALESNEGLTNRSTLSTSSDFTALVICEEGGKLVIAYVAKSRGEDRAWIDIHHDQYVAVGSGRDIALAFMDVTEFYADSLCFHESAFKPVAQNAVEFTAIRDTSTGGNIMVIDCLELINKTSSVTE